MQSTLQSLRVLSHALASVSPQCARSRGWSSRPELASLGKLLVANRGEIACRIIRTARALGVPTVAVYSEADAHAAHTRLADEAVCIGAPPPRASYLNIDRIVEAARRTGAGSVHPGYGFLSENVAFVARCEAEGLAFVGPPATAIHAMGNKSEAKAIMLAAGVPVVPGYHGPEQSEQFLGEQAERIGFPLLVKAVLGGGGKGMKIARSAAEFQDALASARREASAAFNDDAVLLERLIQRPRHVEVQVLADRHGQCVYLFERDCSVQRRHQKVIEEAPAPGLRPAKRKELGEAAVAAARAVGYVNAGTVEFILDRDTEEFYFMEMNTRLQVEHPITEMITGLDLVEFQLRVAAGQRLPVTQQQLRCVGHAFEARIYAERPHAGFLPAVGTLRHWRLPPRAQMFGLDTSAPRVDAGVTEGDDVGVNYDPLIAKLVTWGEDRDEALTRLRGALEGLQAGGLPTNISFLSKLAAHPAFVDCDLDTGFIGRHGGDLLAVEPAPAAALAAAAVAKMAVAMRDEAAGGIVEAGRGASGPWAASDGFRLGPRLEQEVALAEHSGAELQERRARVMFTGPASFEVTVLGAAAGVHRFADVQLQGRQLSYALDGAKCELTLCSYADAARHHLELWLQGRHHHVSWPLQSWSTFASRAPASGELVSPMTGRVTKVVAKEGQRVDAKDVVVVVEAMKMEHAVVAPAAGVVRRVLVCDGQSVQDSSTLAILDLDGDESSST